MTTTPRQPEPLLSPKQVAARLGYSREWTHKAFLATGIIQSFTIGRKRRIEAIAVERFIERQKTQTEWDLKVKGG